MTTHRKIITTVIAAVALGGAGATYAVAGGGNGDDVERQATGPGADRARAAALKLLPGGTANAVERDSENGAVWEVEVTKADGATVDVRLDKNYEKVVIEGDTEDTEDAGGADTDER